MTTKKALLVVGVLIFLLLTTMVIPAKYIGVTPQKTTGIILLDDGAITALAKDKNRNGNPDWRDLLKDNTNIQEPLTAQTPIDPATQKELDDPNNLTASFAKNLYTAATYASQNGGLTEDEQAALASQLIEGEGAKITVKVYTLKDLHLVKNESETFITSYGNNLGVLYKKAVDEKLNSDDTVILKAYTTNQDSSVLEALVVKKNSLETMISKLITLDVPYSAAIYHLRMLNELSKYKSVVENLSTAEIDPMRAAIATREYFPALKSVNGSFIAIVEYFINQKITFTPSDPGAILMKGYTSK